MNLQERPDGIIITLSQKMFRERGYRNWLHNFQEAMASEDMTYWFRTSCQPKFKDLAYLYICAGNKIRFRCNLVMTHGEGNKTFPLDTGNGTTTMYGRAWLVCCGPVTIAPVPRIERKGFRGFRYTPFLF